jgi:ATP-dependent RNA helicase DeaD
VESFEELEVAPELVETLAAEGIERPTPLQQDAIPVLRHGNNLLLAAGPGSGLLVAWAVPLLERVEPGVDAPLVLVLTDSAPTADRLAESVARIAAVTGHTVAALGSPWLLPGRAQIVLGAPAEVLAAVACGAIALGQVQALVVDQAQVIERTGGLGSVEQVIDYIPAEAQRIVSALPVTDGVSDLVERHLRRALTMPGRDLVEPLDRGRVRFRIITEPKEAAALELAVELLMGDARHVLLYTRSDDRAADLGDYLTLHGFVAGAPGEAGAPVWLGVDALAGRGASQGVEGLVVVSHDVPADSDTLDRRHAIGGAGGVVLVLPRELAHLKALGRRTGYETVPFPPPTRRTPTAIEDLRDALTRALEEGEAAPYLPLLEPLFERLDPAEVAAAAVALYRERKAPVAKAAAPPPSAEPAAAPAWAKLFVGVGERDGLRPGDLLGAITGEAGVDGRAVGRIDIKESHSVVEVHDEVARKVIKALNGTTIKGRAVRADFDRPRRPGARAPRAR